MRICILVIMMVFTGCASIVNPYKDEFQCKDTYNGRCADMKTAYDESVHNIDSEAVADMEECKEGNGKCMESYSPLLPSRDRVSQAKRAFQEKQFKKMAKLIDAPVAPVLKPPEVVRVLILSYTSDTNTFLGNRYGYFLATDPEFMLSTTTLTRKNQ